jgi:hypothetical protein
MAGDHDAFSVVDDEPSDRVAGTWTEDENLAALARVADPLDARVELDILAAQRESAGEPFTRGERPLDG